MRCVYCNQSVVNSPLGNPITVKGVGSAHKECFLASTHMSRIFQRLNLSMLNDQELAELYDMVIVERKDRLNREDDELFK